MAYNHPSTPRQAPLAHQAHAGIHAGDSYPDASAAASGDATLSSPPEIHIRRQPRVTRTLKEPPRWSEIEGTQLAAIIRGMDAAVVVVDADGQIVLRNEAYERMFGDANGMRLAEAEDAAGNPIAPAERPEQRATGDCPFSMEFTLTEADGTRRWFAAHGEPVRGADGSPCGGAITVRDITDRNVYRLQNEFVARVSHELGAPLSAIVLSLRMMLRRLPGSSALTEEVQAYTETALWEAERMRVLVGDLVDVSRLQRGRLRLRLQPEDLVPLVRRAVSLAQLGTRTQTFSLDLPDSPVAVTGDATRLEQVLLNLLSNALQHAPESQKVDVRLRVACGEADIEVQDYGPGIPHAELPHLFEHLAGARRTETGGRGGLGLGLYITKELVDAHGGHISVESKEGYGTRFTVGLPLLDPIPSTIVCTLADAPTADEHR